MSKEGLKALIFLFYLVTIGFVVTGLVFGFYYPNYDSELDLGSTFNHTVGGDAYNYIIMAGRGLLWIGMAIVTAIIGAALNICYFIVGKVEVDHSKKTQTNEDKAEIKSEI
ncbi:hypothetical protein [Sporolactobacillus laevolacticus]|uniref:hypothetical protein n=1 Tax=Sporolactobacillus laevolacticus TaxID=33018 RepID=UPI0025B5EFB2|nr:hypothetical protein [Sporolactobacillus laevolacticus]MDN3956216.1 hypothetical protein [Sporolactobacillus laevolacticus]